MTAGSVVLLDGARLVGAVALSDAAGWNQTEQDWRRLGDLEPEGCFGVEVDGAIVATTTVTCYGRSLAWIGMVVTRPEYRRLGFARRLMTRALDYCERRGIDWIKLDATDLGRPLYAALGFMNECVLERWARPASATIVPSPAVDRFHVDYALDLEAFGADRRLLLEALAREGDAACRRGAHAFARPGRTSFHFGPCVARDDEAASDLVSWCLATHAAEDVTWDILATNSKARALARARGFEPVRPLVRMARRGEGGGPALPVDDHLVYATAGFEYG